MKSINLILFFCVLNCFIPHFLAAQISYGGTPYSFGTDFQGLKSVEASLQAIDLPKINWQKIREEDQANPNSTRFAAAIAADFDLKKTGKWFILPNGDKLWQLKIRSAGALGLRVLFSQFKLAPTTQLFIYTENRQTVLGAFTHLNNLDSGRMGTDILPQETIVLEYYEPKGISEPTELAIWRIDHAYRFWKDLEKGFGDSGNCNVNINCPLGDDWQLQKRGVVKIITTQNGGSDLCSGSLINNTRQDRTPYVLSAFHCLGKEVGNAAQAYIDTWVFIFNYEAASCSTPTLEPVSTQSIAGGTFVAGNEGTSRGATGSDFLLVRLKQSVPNSYNAYFNGWDRNTNPPSQTTCIHHPSGDIKKISVDTDPAIAANYLDRTTINKNFWRVRWNANTTTEGGSSGSPLFNQNQKIIGQLGGGSASCGNLNGADYFGMLAVSWNNGTSPQARLQDWLDPLNTGLATVNGLEAQAVNNDLQILNANLAILNCNQIKFWVYNKGINAQTDVLVNYELRDLNNQVVVSDNTNLSNMQTGEFRAISFNLNVNNLRGNYTLIANINTSNADTNPQDNTFSQIITILPQVDTYPYQESFEQDNGAWVSAGTINDWVWGSPAKTRLNRASEGQKAWFTRAAGSYRSNHNGYLISPIFDLSNLSGASLMTDIFVDTEVDLDGVQLQASTDCGQTWHKVGTLNSGINWYNNQSSNLLFQDFGNEAWSGQLNGWQTALYSLSEYQGQKVTFRFLFLADNFSGNFDGFAIDNFKILSLDNDIILTSISSDISPCNYLNKTPFKFQIRNGGVKTQSNLKLEYRLLQNQTQVISNGTMNISSLAVGQSQDILIDFNLTQNNTDYLIEAELKLDNVIDQNPSNNRQKLEVFSIISRFPYRQSFESGRGGWLSGGSRSSWEWGIPNKVLIDRASDGQYAWATHLNTGYNNNEDSFVVSPALDLSNLQNPYLLLDIAQDMEEGFDGVQLQISEDCGSTWTKLGDVQSGKNWYNIISDDLLFSDFENEAWSTEDEYWVTAYTSLRSYAGKKNILLRWLFRSDASVVREGVAFDNIRIIDIQDFLKNSVLIYPNPTKDILKISLEPALGEFKVVRVTVFDILGREMLQDRIDFFSTTPHELIEFPVNGLPSGTYFLKIETDKGNFSQRFIKY
ncbi:MAG: immune inhibitor A [Microscillaceae bacterium]|jgi:hypothetical protein|nr:immune inhibitor A [Microscillaceae bacterium]